MVRNERGGDGLAVPSRSRFGPRSSVRSFEDYDPEHAPNLQRGQETRRLPFAYTDGGVLQNQPLGMAKNLVDLNHHHQHQENRFYLFVSPSPMSGMQNLALGETTMDMAHRAAAS